VIGQILVKQISFPGSFRVNMRMTGAKAHGTLNIFSVFAKNVTIFAKT
jgi:hypothetical protein